MSNFYCSELKEDRIPIFSSRAGRGPNVVLKEENLQERIMKQQFISAFYLIYQDQKSGWKRSYKLTVFFGQGVFSM